LKEIDDSVYGVTVTELALLLLILLLLLMLLCQVSLLDLV
jgi:hypothetical protein